MRSLEHVGRGIERKLVRSSKTSGLEKKIFIDKNGLEQGTLQWSLLRMYIQVCQQLQCVEEEESK